MELAEEKQAGTSFSEEKEAKRLFYAGPWALVRPQAMAQRQKFLRRFFQKAASC